MNNKKQISIFQCVIKLSKFKSKIEPFNIKPKIEPFKIKPNIEPFKMIVQESEHRSEASRPMEYAIYIVT